MKMFLLVLISSIAMASSVPKQSVLVQDQIAVQTDQLKQQADQCTIQAAGSQTKTQADQCAANAANGQVHLDQLNAKLATLQAAGN